ncbi:hypothetical protein G9406_06540 [Weissella paramesenteroides]|jgi:hypothetical protein|uniref:hypothetical protein n=1 Tax=Weissella paramesenteroides TaxID=1249 RepID=UPI002402CBF8|nr:hypothetical protein [Weissella paramesenteroides]MDF8367233.1 hypothetical protein [Weissella paramesenteroides]
MEKWNLNFDQLTAEIELLSAEELNLAKQLAEVLNTSQLSAYEKNRALCVVDKVLYHKTLGKSQTELLK